MYNKEFLFEKWSQCSARTCLVNHLGNINTSSINVYQCVYRGDKNIKNFKTDIVI